MYLLNKTNVAQKSKEYYVKNTKTHKEKSLLYYRSNTAERSVKMADWYAKNKDSVAAYGVAWRSKNKDKKAAATARRRALLLKATPKWANKEKIDEFYLSANKLGMLTGEWFHVDHIVPLKGKNVCGLHYENNLQILRGPENLSKSNRFLG